MVRLATFGSQCASRLALVLLGLVWFAFGLVWLGFGLVWFGFVWLGWVWFGPGRRRVAAAQKISKVAGNYQSAQHFNVSNFQIFRQKFRCFLYCKSLSFESGS